MARPGDALHRRDRYHSHFHGTSWGVSLKYLQQVPRRSPQRRLRRFLPLVDDCPDLGNPYGAFGIRLTRRHVRDRTAKCRSHALPPLAGPAPAITARPSHVSLAARASRVLGRWDT
jgi:hypothetical protein